MSWLSSLFGGGGEDPNAVIQRQQMAAQQQAAANAQALQDQQNTLATQRERDLQALIDQQQAFDEYQTTLTPAPTPTVDPRIQQREDLRSGATNSLKALLGPGFENTYVPDTADDALAGQIYGEQRGKADTYLNNLLKRGVITDTGYAAGAKELDNQGSRVRTQLRDLGNSLLEAERGQVRGIYGRGADTASTLDVGQTFDPNVFAKMINDNVSEFNTNFGDTFRAGVPGDLFDTSGLSAIAGGAQGAGNKAFDPAAVAGAISSDETTDDETKVTPKKRTSTVF